VKGFVGEHQLNQMKKRQEIPILGVSVPFARFLFQLFHFGESSKQRFATHLELVDPLISPTFHINKVSIDTFNANSNSRQWTNLFRTRQKTGALAHRVIRPLPGV
jgi:hypothetical protein